MIQERATLIVKPESMKDFEAAVAKAEPLFKKAAGFRSFGLERIIEHPGQYHLVVGWETVVDHMETFRNSEAFTEWRALVGPFLVEPPAVVHTEDTMISGTSA